MSTTIKLGLLTFIGDHGARVAVEVVGIGSRGPIPQHGVLSITPAEWSSLVDLSQLAALAEEQRAKDAAEILRLDALVVRLRTTAHRVWQRLIDSDNSDHWELASVLDADGELAQQSHQARLDKEHSHGE